jgi:hypothetical protein
MSLVCDIKRWYEEKSHPPEGPELGEDVEQVSWTVLNSGARWGNSIEIIYNRGDEFVGVYDEEPAYEMQAWGDLGPPEIAPVEPYKVTVTKYRRVQ